MSERDQRNEVEAWVSKQVKKGSIPSRKEAQEKFPTVPQRIVKQVLQSATDRAQG